MLSMHQSMELGVPNFIYLDIYGTVRIRILNENALTSRSCSEIKVVDLCYMYYSYAVLIIIAIGILRCAQYKTLKPAYVCFFPRWEQVGITVNISLLLVIIHLETFGQM